jgi:hypothetical protein
MKGRRLTDQEFLSVLGAPPPGPRWDLDQEGRFLMLPIVERDLAWMLECCREHAEGDYHVLRDGDAVVFARAHDFAFARLLAL